MFRRNINAKEYFLSLYNAIHGTDFKIGEVEIKPIMLENVVYKGLENDMSMEINGAIVVLAEQQSTVNHNMPFRCLEYLVAHYNRFFEKSDKYGTKQIKLPRRGSVLADYFSAIGKEEQSMIFGEWDEEEFRKVMKREAFEDGMEEGTQQANRNNARNLLRMNILTTEQIAQAVSLPLEEIFALQKELSSKDTAQA